MPGLFDEKAQELVRQFRYKMHPAARQRIELTLTLALRAAASEATEQAAKRCEQVALGPHHPDTLWACVNVIRGDSREPRP